MGRKSLGWSAIILGVLGVAAFVILIAAAVSLRGSANDWAQEYLQPASRAIDRLAFRLTETGRHTETVNEDVAKLVKTGSAQLLEAARRNITQVQMDLVALEASIMSVDSGMNLVSELPLFEDERRGFREAVRLELAALREELARVDLRLAEGEALAAEIRRGGDAAEKARTALRALARNLAPRFVAIQSFLAELAIALIEVKARLATAVDRIGQGLTTATAVVCFIFAWLAFAHFCVYLAGKRILEEGARLAAEAGGDLNAEPPPRL